MIVYQGSEKYSEEIGLLRTLYKWDFDPFAYEINFLPNVAKPAVAIQRTINHVWEYCDDSLQET